MTADPRDVADVLVVGAGPAGSAAAILFADAGLRVRLLERERLPRFKPCGDFLSPEATGILRRLGVEPAVVAAGARKLRGLLVSAGGGPPLRADFDGAGGFGYALERSRLDAVLAERARGAGAEVLEGWLVERLGPDASHQRSDTATRTLRVRTPAGEPLELRARLVVGAGGRHCPVARDLGLRLPFRGERRVDLLAHWSVPRDADPYCEMHVVGPGYVGTAAAGRNLVNANAVVPASWIRARRAEHRRAGRELRRRLYREVLGAAAPVVRTLRGGAPVYDPVASDVTPLETSRATAAGVLLAGDSALFLDPFTGQGIYLALRSAELAAEIGSEALRDAGPTAARLAPYDERRRSEFGPKAALSRVLQALLGRPWLARRVAGTLRRDLRGAERLVGAIGDYRPAADLLRRDFLVRLMAAA
ncbi:MAG TPA: NAD(P)/FAD-dependent oxidoreductase [Gemmatimonadota bacterium]